MKLRQLSRESIAIIAAIGVAVIAVAASLGWWAVVAGLVAVLQAAILVFLVDIRRRTARASELRRVAETVSDVRERVEATAGALIQALEASRAEAGEIVQQMRSRLEELRQDVGHDIERGTRRLDRAGVRRAREIEAMLQLFSRVQPRAGMPSSGGWALNAPEILTLLDLVTTNRPKLVVELGSGTSSVWLGYALERSGNGRVISIEHDPDFAGRTKEDLRRHGLEDVVEVRTAPLVASPVPGHETPWYDPVAFEDLDGIDLLVVDGPPGPTGPLARYPALPLLHKRLSEQAVIVLDDIDREGEQEIVERWYSEVPGWQRTVQRPGTRLAVLDRVKP